MHIKLIDPIFQNECKQLFSFEKFGIKCHYSPAPVKTKERCITKAELGMMFCFVLYLD